MVNDLIFVKPEEEGLSSCGISDFITALEKYKLNMHSFMFVRNGKILAEAYYKPFNKDFAHRIYSCSKSYVALSIGKMIGEGLVKLDDKMSDYFPEYVTEKTGKYMRALTIEDCLKMTTPLNHVSYHDPNWSMKKSGWNASFFSGEYQEIKPNGMLFQYDTAASYMLDVLVEKLTGKTFLEYLRPEFDKIGVSKDIWCVKSPDGNAWGGSGVVTTMRDFAKVGELVLNLGNYKGEQLLPLGYMQKATSKQIDTIFDNYYDYEECGYGYQIWRHPHGFMLNGMGGQFIFCFPDKNFMFVCNADLQCSGSSGSKIYYFVEKLYKSLDKGAEFNQADYDKLTTKINSLELVNGFGEKHSPIEKVINGKKYVFNENPMGIKWAKVEIGENDGKFIYENTRGIKTIPFGLEKHVQFDFPETDYYDTQVWKPANRGLHSVASAAFTMENNLLIRVNVIDTCFGHLAITLQYKDDICMLKMLKVAETFLFDYQGVSIGMLEK